MWTGREEDAGRALAAHGPPWLVSNVVMNRKVNGRAQSVAEGCGQRQRRFSIGLAAPLLAAIVVVLPHPVFGAAGMSLQAFAVREFGRDLAERLRAFRADLDHTGTLEEIVDAQR